uniref:Uncharacterized protein n=1 Tax=Rhizophora mucronata TaxID=61149 RepID=A0A2P2IRL3_RHIMU
MNFSNMQYDSLNSADFIFHLIKILCAFSRIIF